MEEKECYSVMIWMKSLSQSEEQLKEKKKISPKSAPIIRPRPPNGNGGLE
jgi:hypothetical protein